MKTDIFLASASPRRKQLLEDAGIEFTTLVVDVDETLEPDLENDPSEGAKKLAERKAGAVVQQVLADPSYVGTAVVIGADTMVVLENEIFGKPVSASDATHMLKKLSGRTHDVVTAVSVWCVVVPEPEKVSMGFRSFCESSAVTFKDLSDQDIKDYLLKGESFDKAGAYAAQGAGRDLIANIEGDIDTVIGLPVTKLLEEFSDLLKPEE